MYDVCNPRESTLNKNDFVHKKIINENHVFKYQLIIYLMQ